MTTSYNLHTPSAQALSSSFSEEAFWKEVKKITKDNEMDEILSYMFLLIKKAKEKEISCKKENFKKHGKTVEYFSGVEQYFTNITK
jgi:hypothetical protein